MSRNILFYTTLGCHLCEDAKALIKKSKFLRHIEINEVEIAEHENLVEKWGDKIPFIEIGSQHEKLFWPFSLVELDQFIQGASNISD